MIKMMILNISKISTFHLVHPIPITLVPRKFRQKRLAIKFQKKDKTILSNMKFIRLKIRVSFLKSKGLQNLLIHKNYSSKEKLTKKKLPKLNWRKGTP